MEWWAILLVTVVVTLLFLAACEDWGATERRIQEIVNRDKEYWRKHYEALASKDRRYWVDMTKVGK